MKGYTAGSAKEKDIMGGVWKSLDVGFQRGGVSQNKLLPPAIKYSSACTVFLPREACSRLGVFFLLIGD